MKITKRSDIQTIASIVCDCLLNFGIDAVLSGGAVVSIYTNNEYESKDLDFISSSDIKDIEKALTEIGFSKSSGRHFTHPETEYFVEFPKPPLAIGDMPIKEWATQNNKAGKLQLLTPTHSVMDRLAGYFHWNDKQNLDQALMIAKKHPIKIQESVLWAVSYFVRSKTRRIKFSSLPF
ncbi:MAG: hypothetical protein IPM97_08105 [Bdellovibrionaceae bacterium]|nr:hypothetical protein [Pseudobdellovibrionaceae bacterium]